jgi:polyisoprenoid-binding protein YceI
VTVTGNLTMHGQTNEISFPATIDVADGHVTLNSEFKVDRTKFGMNYPGKPDDPINADVDIRIMVGAVAGSVDDGAQPAE